MGPRISFEEKKKKKKKSKMILCYKTGRENSGESGVNTKSRLPSFIDNINDASLSSLEEEASLQAASPAAQRRAVWS